jgi:hypothetical protein
MSETSKEEGTMPEGKRFVHITFHFKHNRSGMVAVLGPFEALPCYIHTYYFPLYINMGDETEEQIMG